MITMHIALASVTCLWPFALVAVLYISCGIYNQIKHGPSSKQFTEGFKRTALLKRSEQQDLSFLEKVYPFRKKN